MKRLWRDYSLTIVLAILFLAAWGGQTYAGWVKFSSEQLSHNETPVWLGPNGYLYEWLAATLENWQSEWLQLLSFVILTAFLIHKGSHESKDSDEKMQATLDRIEGKLTEIESRMK